MGCPQYRREILYEITLTGGGATPVTKELEGGSCSSVCSVLFSVAMLGDGNFLLQLRARNGISVSNIVAEKSIFIGEYVKV